MPRHLHEGRDMRGDPVAVVLEVATPAEEVREQAALLPLCWMSQQQQQLEASPRCLIPTICHTKNPISARPAKSSLSHQLLQRPH